MIYKVIRIETCTQTAYIDTETCEAAREIAIEQDNVYWRENQDVEHEIVVVNLEVGELRNGTIVDTAIDHYTYTTK